MATLELASLCSLHCISANNVQTKRNNFRGNIHASESAFNAVSKNLTTNTLFILKGAGVAMKNSHQTRLVIEAFQLANEAPAIKSKNSNGVCNEQGDEYITLYARGVPERLCGLHLQPTSGLRKSISFFPQNAATMNAAKFYLPVVFVNRPTRHSGIK